MKYNTISPRKSYINLIDISLDFPPSSTLSFNISAINTNTQRSSSNIVMYPNSMDSKTSLRHKTNTSSLVLMQASSVETWRVSVVDTMHDHDDEYRLIVSLKGLSAQGIVFLFINYFHRYHYYF